MIVQRKEEIRQEEIQLTFDQAEDAELQVDIVKDLGESAAERHEEIKGLVDILEEGANAARREKGVVQQARVRAMLESFKKLASQGYRQSIDNQWTNLYVTTSQEPRPSYDERCS